VLIWPPELPQRFNTDGYRETPANLDRETGVELGIAMAGRRNTAGARLFVGNMDMRDWQCDRLDRFYQYEAKGRANVWTFPRPRVHGSLWLDTQGNPVTTADGSTIEISAHVVCRFVKPVEYPGWRNGVWWIVPLSLEAIPS
jgi:hypothetical protein